MTARTCSSLVLAAAIGAAALVACGSDDSTIAPQSDTPKKDPFAAQPDTSEGLVNVSADLDALLEKGALNGACEAYFAGKTDRRTMLLCGKWMYFYESFDTSGPPTELLKVLMDELPDHIGKGFSKQGMILDPSSSMGLPLGLAKGKDLAPGVTSVTFTCASCHFAKLPDGRFAVGAPNHDYDYGTQTLAFSMVPILALGSDPSQHDPAAVAKVMPMAKVFLDDQAKRDKLIAALQKVAGATSAAPMLTPEVQHAYATWLPGTQDFLMAPVPIDDGVHTVSKIPPLFGLPSPDELAREGMTSVMIGWTGSTKTLSSFLNGFVVLGAGDPAAYGEEKLRPLAEYLYSLRAPTNPSPAAPGDVKAGEAVFQRACASCHDGPRGMGRKVYGYDEIGTDKAMAGWGNEKVIGKDETLTHGIKSPRLVALWAQKRFLHNGAVPTLGDLLCENGKRPFSPEPYGAEGHDMGCELSAADRASVKAYLLAH